MRVTQQVVASRPSDGGLSAEQVDDAVFVGRQHPGRLSQTFQCISCSVSFSSASPRNMRSASAVSSERLEKYGSS